MTKEEQARVRAMNAYRRGEKVETILRRLGRSRSWFYKWLKRYQSAPKTDEWSEERSKRPQGNARQVPEKVVARVTEIRRELQQQGLFSGAQVIHWELQDRGCQPLPSLRTINRIIEREGLGQRREGRYVPKGTPYPKLLATAANDVHQSDFVGPCYLTGGGRFYRLNSVDLATARCAVTPQLDKTAQSTIDGF
jgi:transposase InsO family protein